MKKLFAMVLALVFFASTSGLVFAQSSTAPAATPTVKKVMKKKSHKKVKKTVVPASTPVSQ